jgi:hypothetical protein
VEGRGEMGLSGRGGPGSRDGSGGQEGGGYKSGTEEGKVEGGLGMAELEAGAGTEDGRWMD